MKELNVKYIRTRIDSETYNKFRIYSLQKGMNFNEALIDLIKTSTQGIDNQKYPISDDDMYYMAGLLDGDGTICITKEKTRESYSPAVHLSSTDFDIVKFFQMRFGGTIRNVDSTKKRKFVWYAQGIEAIDTVTEFLPFIFLTRKVHAAKCVIEFGKTLSEHKLSKEIIDSRKNLYLQSKNTNAHGHNQSFNIGIIPPIQYLAGIFDAEGCARVTRCKSQYSTQYGIALLVKMCDYEPIVAFHKTYGGNLCECKPGKTGRKPSALWRINGKEAGNIAKNIMQFSRCKRKGECLSIINEFSALIGYRGTNTKRELLYSRYKELVK